MAVLERTPGMSQRELGDELDLDRSTINDLVLRLEKRGLIKRAQASDDKRRKVLELTPAGNREFTALQPAVARVQEILTGELTGSETAKLREILTTLLGGKP